MPIIASPSTAIAALATTTAGDIMDACSRDLNSRLGTGPRSPLLIDYVNRAQQHILGVRRWDWLMSVPQRFITERGQTEYWIGPSGAEDVGMVDTGLDLSDVRQVKKGHVYNRSRWTEIFNVAESPNDFNWQRSDGAYIESEPQNYRNDRLTPNVISLYPAPDTGSDYEIVPHAPHSTTATGGALSARTYYLRVTFVDAAGNESLPSTTARQWVAASKLLTVKAPQPELSISASGIGYTSYNVYASTTEGSETKQGSSNLITADWTEDATGLTITGDSVPTESTIEPLRGYLMEFRYYRAHTPITSDDDVLLVPDDFKDVVIAGTNWYAAQYLHRQESIRDQTPEVAFWEMRFREGIQRMVRDNNPWPSGGMFIGPDPGMTVSWW